MTTVESQPASATGASDPNLPRSSLFTCLACQVAFQAAEEQRIHYKTDWHRYNLKRKVAGLPSVTAEQFAARLAALQQRSNEEEGRASFSAECTVCRKTYYSENAFTNHVNSRKHRENEARASTNAPADTEDGEKDAMSTSTPKSAPRVDLVATSEAAESDVNNIIDAKIATSQRLSPETDCLFCPHISANLEENMSHMARGHSFFIPDIEYLVDLRGLITYLGEKISVGNVCLFCNGKGRGLKSLEAVRKHMLDKGHCKIAYAEEDDAMEVVDFYDFSASYPPEEALQPADGEEEGLEDLVAGAAGIRLAGDGTELVLPSGVRIGHRSLRRYYEQSLRPEEARDSVIIGRLITQYGDEFGYSGSGARRTRGLIGDGRAADSRRVPDGFRDQKARRDFDTRVGIKANGLQKHFRDQNP